MTFFNAKNFILEIFKCDIASVNALQYRQLHIAYCVLHIACYMLRWCKIPLLAPFFLISRLTVGQLEQVKANVCNNLKRICSRRFLDLQGTNLKSNFQLSAPSPVYGVFSSMNVSQYLKYTKQVLLFLNGYSSQNVIIFLCKQIYVSQ